jgi:membrane associated rhomboid family serine protease
MTDWLVAVTTIVFVITFLTGHVDSAAQIGGFVPLRADDPDLFRQLGGPANTIPFWLTPIVTTLIHGSWLHIGFNMLMLMFCGRHVEHALGPWLMLSIYCIGAYAAAAAEWFLDPMAANPMIGASGAISALLGTYALLYSQQKVRAVGPVSANVVRILWLAAGWIAIQLMLSVATSGSDGEFGHIAIAAHIGGFVAGLITTRPAIFLRFRQRPARAK